MVEMKSVDSSNVDSVGYDAETKTLHVKFKSGGVYHYHGVEPEAHSALMNAESIGWHLGTHIKGKHKFSKPDS